jgi:predicted permease
MREWLARLVDRFRRGQLDAELAEELRFHQAQLERDARAAGTADDDAAAAARRQLGNVTRIREIARDRWSVPWLDHLEQDVRYAIRGLRRSPGFTFGVVLTLGLGLGANASIFAVVDRLLFRPPPALIDPSRVNQIYLSFPLPDLSDHFVLNEMPYRRYLDLARWTTSFDRTSVFDVGTVAVGAGQDAREMTVAAVSASYFGFFDAPPALGRYLNAEDDAPPAGSPVAVLTYTTWQALYAGRRDVLGTTLQIGPATYTIVGVAPRGFVGLQPDQRPVAFIPFAAWAAVQDFGPRNQQWWSSYKLNIASVVVRRKPGVSVEAAAADLNAAVLRSWEAEGGAPAPLQPTAIAASILAERGPNATSSARVAALVGGMALIVLLIAAANVANLLLTRALRRRREIAMRLALGVSQGRLVSHLVMESVLLALLGGVAGLAIARWGSAALRTLFLPPGVDAPVVGDARTVLFVGGAVLTAGLLAGLAPAWQTRSVDLTRDLKSGVREGLVQRSRLRIALLVVQAALSVMLLVGAGLFVQSLVNVRRVRLGYDVAPVLAVDLVTRGVQLDSARTAALRDRLLDAARTVPGVERAALDFMLPLTGLRLAGSLSVPGMDPALASGLPNIYMNVVSSDYFPAMGIRVLRGRAISTSDVAGAPGAIVVSNSLAKLFWPGKEALGQCVRFGDDKAPCTYVVGVAEDIKNVRLADDPGLYIHRPAAQSNPRQLGLVIRTRGDAAPFVEAVRQRLQREMPGASYVRVRPYADIVGERLKSWRLGATMFVVFGILAVVLAAIGLYGVVSYSVAQRTHELGVRRALGAQSTDVVGLILRHGLSLVAVGVVIGGAVTVALAGRVAPLLFGVSPRDPMVYALAAVSMVAVAALASLLPARRAARIDPQVALRSE